MITPMIHLNGTSRETLIDQHKLAIDKIEEALQALEGCAPNARDYYLYSFPALKAAESDHVNRVEKLKNVKSELITMLDAIYNQNWKVSLSTDGTA